MSVLDKMKNWIIAPDGEDDDYEDDYDYDYDEQPAKEETTYKPSSAKQSTTKPRSSLSVVSPRTVSNSFKIQIQDPLKYEDAPKIIDKLIQNNAVVVNFEHLEPELKRQVFDFINGGIYAVEGKIQKVTKDIFILAPRDVAIEGIKEELMESGLYTW